MSGLRVMLDTNVLVSGLAYPASIPGRIINTWRQGCLDIVLSRYILDELIRALPRLPLIQLSPDEIRDLADSLMFLADIVEPEPKQNKDLRDPSGQPVLSTFCAANAQYLITGDKDLLALAQQYPIVTPAAFWIRHGV